MTLIVDLKRRLRALPQWGAIGAYEPQTLVRVHLEAGGSRVDVTLNHVVAALRPLTLAIGLEGPLHGAVTQARAPTLHFLDQASGQRIGSLELRWLNTEHIGTAEIALFHIVRSKQRCLRSPYREWNRWRQTRAASRNRSSNNFTMTPRSQQEIMIFYICPRPVVLVSVKTAEHGNIFPMDLIGPIGQDLFTLALRSTSQSIEAMKAARRIALADVAASDVSIAHALGTHHKKRNIDWSALPFPLERSVRFALPVPATALRVREMQIVDHRAVGSHTFFICRQVSEHKMRDALTLCHTSGLYQHFRSRQRRPLPT